MRTVYQALFTAIGLIVASMTVHATEVDRPNIVLLLADDMGYADPACFGGEAVATPNLDRLADEGVRLTQFYAGSAVCTPTRASILTGRYPLRFGIIRHFSDDEHHLPRGTVTLPRLLQRSGYRTAHVGKWHLGGLHVEHLEDRSVAIPGPHQHGFDHYLCQIEQQPIRGQLGGERRLYRDGGTCLIRDEQVVGPDDPFYEQHWTDIIGDESERLIRQMHAEGRPFFLNVWWLVPHTPYEPAPEPHWSATAAEGIRDDQHRFRSMVAHQDARIGRILDLLDALGIADETLVLFTSDNGAAYEGQIGPFRGGKTDLHEGGIRVPMIARWPGQIAPGTTSEVIGHTNDLLPTLCAVASIPLPGHVRFDGGSLLDVLRGDAPTADLTDRTLLWQIDFFPRIQRRTSKPEPFATEAARWGPWKLLSRDGQPKALHDLTADPGEVHNRIDDHPEIVDRLANEVRALLDAPRDGGQTDLDIEGSRQDRR